MRDYQLHGLLGLGEQRGGRTKCRGRLGSAAAEEAAGSRGLLRLSKAGCC